MIKIISFSLIIYWIGFFIGSFICNAHGIGLSIPDAVYATSLGVKNGENLSHERAERDLALLIPFNENDESHKDHQKIKRCWKANPVEKIKLSEKNHKETKYNLKKLYLDKKGSVEESKEESWESNESLDNHRENKFSYLKFIPVKNPKINLKEFLSKSRDVPDDTLSNQSEESSENFYLKKMRNRHDSGEYNVFALVGKKAKNAGRNSRNKYICYCREADCPGGNCQRIMYRPCSTCKNASPGFVGKINSDLHTNGNMNGYRSHEEIQSTDSQIPLNIQYPVISKKEFTGNPIESNHQLKDLPGIPLLGNDHKNFQQNLLPVQNRGHQLSYDNPTGFVSSGNANNNIQSSDQYRILHNHRSENVNFPPDHSLHNQWGGNAYYPPIHNPGNLRIRNNINRRIDTPDFINLYQSNDNRFSGQNIPFANHGRIFPLSQPPWINLNIPNNVNKNQVSLQQQQNVKSPLNTLNLEKETNFKGQLERPDNEELYSKKYDENTPTEIHPSDFGEDAKSLGTKPVDLDVNTSSEEMKGEDYSDIQVITNGYFTSRTYDDLEGIDGKENPVTDKNKMENDLQNENERAGLSADSENHSANFGKNNIMESDEEIESLENAEKPSVQIIGKEEPGDSREEYIQKPDEIGRKNSEGYSQLVESHKDVSYSGNPVINQATEDISPEVFIEENLKSPTEEIVETKNTRIPQSHNIVNNYNCNEDQVGKEITDIGNTPTRYFTPNDRVLEYIKKHTENSLGHVDPVGNNQRNIYSTGTEEESQTNLNRKESSEENDENFNSGSESEQEIISTKQSDDYNHVDKSVNVNSEEEEEDSLSQAPRYEEHGNMMTANCGGHITEIKSINNKFGRFEGLGKPLNQLKYKESQNKMIETDIHSESDMKKSEDYETHDHYNHKEYLADVNNNENHEAYRLHDNQFIQKSYSQNIEGNKSEDKLGWNLQHEEKSAPEDEMKFNPIISEAEGPVGGTNVSNEKNKPEESASRDISDNETEELLTKYNDSTAMNGESPKESNTEHTAKDVLGYYDLATHVENSQELDDKKPEFHQLEDEFIPYKYEFDSTESSRSSEESVESSTDYNEEDLYSFNKYSQYNEQGNPGFEKKLQILGLPGKKSFFENYNKNEKFLVGQQFHESPCQRKMKTNPYNDEIVQTHFQNEYNNFKENINNFKSTLDHSWTTIRNNPILEMNKFEGTTSAYKNDEPAVDLVDQNKYVSQHTINSDENYSNSAANVKDGYDHADKERENLIELKNMETTTITEDIYENTNDFVKQENQESMINTEDNSTPNYKFEEISPETRNVKLMSRPRSTECHTKLSEIEEDPGYLGRLEPRKSNSDIESLGDIVDSDLYYIGDGVKLPLTIKKLKDGSFALRISDAICEKRLNEKCPCCVPREGRILQEKHIEIDEEKSIEKNSESISVRRRAIPDNDDESKIQNKRITRSISMPVDKFVEKYNLVLNSNELIDTNNRGNPFTATESSLQHNVIERDMITNEAQPAADNNFVQKLALIDKAAKNNKEDVLLSTLQELIATDSKEVLGIVNGMKKKLHSIISPENDQEDGKSGIKKARYGYQKDNPMLERIKIIKRLQKEAERCKHRYQEDCDDAITQKTELLTMILYWIKELIMNSPNQNVKE